MAERIRASVRGAVQGVGFRPFVHRLARAEGLAGWVANERGRVVAEVEGERRRLERFLERLAREAPAPARVEAVEAVAIEPARERGFRIAESRLGDEVAIPPADLATCAECRDEALAGEGRRAGYAFVSCARCGPRFTIAIDLPYDRERTTMRAFPMCAECRREYEDPSDRRFHAQTNACPACGPRLALRDGRGRVVARDAEALARAARLLAAGGIVALKALGGFQLLVDACDGAAVRRLRERKAREAKPFAVLVASVAEACRHARVSAAEESVLASPAAPIVLLERRARSSLAAEVAPGCPRLGLMLPSTPLHHLLAGALGRPLIATSGNLSGEPLCWRDAEALDRLGRVADLFLVHDREIAQPADDSVVWVFRGEPCAIRLGRGLAPLVLDGGGVRGEAVARGAFLKNTVAVARRGRIYASAHVGDLDSPRACDLSERARRELERFVGAGPAVVVTELRSDEDEPGALAVQHHHAHVLAALADAGVSGPVLGVAWDGTGHGPDGTVWGGEFLAVDGRRCERVGRLRRFRLPGGERAVREGRRAALGLLYEASGAAALERSDLAPVASFPASERGALLRLLERGVAAPRTSSAGRLFDAVAALVGLRQRSSFEGQAAMELEAVARDAAGASCYDMPVARARDGLLRVDWEPMLRALLSDLARGERVALVAARFHASLVSAIVAVARAVGEDRVVLTGGCFQNALLLGGAVRELERAGLRPLWHRRVPTNDGGIAVGQARFALARAEG